MRNNLSVVTLTATLIWGSGAPANSTPCLGIGLPTPSVPQIRVGKITRAGNDFDRSIVSIEGFLGEVGYGRRVSLCPDATTVAIANECILLSFDVDALGRWPEALRALRAMEGRVVRVVGRFEHGSGKERAPGTLDVYAGYLDFVSSVHVVDQGSEAFCLEHQREVLSEKRLRDCLLDTTIPFACFDPWGPVIWIDEDWDSATNPTPIRYGIPSGFDLEDLTDAAVLSKTSVFLQYGDTLYRWNGTGPELLETSAGRLLPEPVGADSAQSVFVEIRREAQANNRTCPAKRVDSHSAPQCSTEAALMFLCELGQVSHEFAPGQIACLGQDDGSIWVRSPGERYARLEFTEPTSGGRSAIVQDFEAESAREFLFSTSLGLFRWDQTSWSLIDDSPTSALLVVEGSIYYRTAKGEVRRVVGESWSTVDKPWEQLRRIRTPRGLVGATLKD